MTVYHPLCLDFPDKIEHFLGASHGERGNDHVSPAVQRSLDYIGQKSHAVGLGALLVQTVAIGGLDYQIVRCINGLRVLDNGLIAVAHISGKDDLPFYPAFL